MFNLAIDQNPFEMNKIAILIFFTSFFLINSSFAQNETKAKQFLNFLVEEKFNEASLQFNEQVAAQINAAQLSQIWNSLKQQMGNFEKLEHVKSRKNGDKESLTLLCAFEKSSIDLNLSYDENGKIAGIFFKPSKANVKYNVPEYVKIEEIQEIPTEFKTGDFKFPAILTLPKNGKNFPVVVLVHGSGALDRDLTINKIKPFKDLAWGLASMGIASLRYDKRTAIYGGQSVKPGEKLTVEQETILDALSAIEFCKSFEQIDSNKIYLIGHSLGGMLAPRIASRSNSLSGIVIMAGNSRPLEDLILEQYSYIFGLDGLDDEEKLEIKSLERKTKLVKSENLNLETPESQLPLKLPASYWMDLKKYNQIKTAKSLKINILVLQGERDYQVTMQDFKLWKKNLKKKAQYISYPKLNHPFMEGNGKEKATPSEYGLDGNIPEYVIMDIANWILEN